MKIPIAKPYIGEEEKQAAAGVLGSGWLVQGTRVAELEQMICKFTGAKFARASSSCTTALHLALVSLGIGPGDEVLVPSFTFVASANAIEYTGAKPVFIDIDLSTFNIDVSKVEKYLSHKENHKTRVTGIMPVHLFGHCADMSAIMELAKRYKLIVIEDAACALGSFWGSHHAGTLGDVGCFSFHPRKLITTGEGGMVATNNSAVAAKVHSLRNHGAVAFYPELNNMDDTLLPAYDVCGYNYRMTDIQGAIGVEQMKKLKWILDKRNEKAQIYNEHLKEIDWLQTPVVLPDCLHAYQSYVTLVIDRNAGKFTSERVKEMSLFRNKIMAGLAERGIATRQGTHAIHMLSYYKRKYKLKDEDYFASFTADKLSMSLPLYPQMTDEEQDYVISMLITLMKR